VGLPELAGRSRALGPDAVRRVCLRWSNGPQFSIADRLTVSDHSSQRLPAGPDGRCTGFVTMGLDPYIRSEHPGLLHGLLWPRDPASHGLAHLRG
jgi:hypothetical protein